MALFSDLQAIVEFIGKGTSVTPTTGLADDATVSELESRLAVSFRPASRAQ